MVDDGIQETFAIRDIELCLWPGYDPPPASTMHRIYMHKDRRFLSALCNVIDRLSPRRIVEIGIFHGGSAIYWAERYADARVVAFDGAAGAPMLASYLERHALADRVRPHFGVMQDDVPMLRDALEADLRNEPIDVVIDDASHVYDPTRVSLETLLPFVRPGGAYIIEDWAWPPMMPLLAELPQIAWHPSGAVARMEIDKNFLVLWRGHAELPLDGSFSLTTS